MSSRIESIKERNSFSFCDSCTCYPKVECRMLVEKNKYEIKNLIKATVTPIFKSLIGKENFRLCLKSARSIGGGISNRYCLVILGKDGKLIDSKMINLTSECCPTMRSILYQINLIKELKTNNYVIKDLDYEDDQWMAQIVPFPQTIKSGDSFFIGEFVFDSEVISKRTR